MSHEITFHDSHWYCYANSTAMLLSSVGEPVSPRLIEVLSGVGLGASFNGPLPFFGELQPPDRGIIMALDLLGLDVDEEASSEGALVPFERLRSGPAIVGPLDMHYLAYNPARPRTPGVDHYVLVLEAVDERFRLHDPAGFAHALLDSAALEKAWRADDIGYRRGPYRSWRNPRRVSSKAPDSLLDRAVAGFRTLYREAAQNGGCIGEAALLKLIEIVRDGALTGEQRGHLTHFALPLGAKRALDYAAFFDRRAPNLAKLKRRQAALFGACHAACVAEANEDAALQLSALAELEPRIKDGIFAT